MSNGSEPYKQAISLPFGCLLNAVRMKVSGPYEYRDAQKSGSTKLSWNLQHEKCG